MKKIIGILLIFGLIFIGVLANYKHTERKEVLVKSLVTQQEIRGNDGTVLTVYKYLINTDKGTYRITSEGIYSSNCFGSLEENKTYMITTRGYSFTLIGMYSYIIDAYEITGN